MKMLGMLCAVEDGDTVGTIIISPKDDMWFIMADHFPPEMQKARETIEAKGRAVVVGAICGSETDA